ncbi:unnamed protein product [Auanema sp. JU1783]|nr:unnamed protein product [Auanema sp. JU1783]
MKVLFTILIVSALYFGYVTACAAYGIGIEKYRKIDVSGFYLPIQLVVSGRNVTNGIINQAAVSPEQARQRVMTVTETVVKRVIGDLMQILGLGTLIGDVERQILVDTVSYEPITCQEYKTRLNSTLFTYASTYICVVDDDNIIRNVCDNMTTCNLNQHMSIPSEYRQLQITLKIRNSIVGTWTSDDWNRFSRSFQTEMLRTEFGTAFNQARITVS